MQGFHSITKPSLSGQRDLDLLSLLWSHLMGTVVRFRSLGKAIWKWLWGHI